MKSISIKKRTVNKELSKLYFIVDNNILTIRQITLTKDADVIDGQTPLKCWRGKVLVYRSFNIRLKTLAEGLELLK